MPITKKRTWLVRGRKVRTKEKTRTLGSIRYSQPVSRTQALKRAKRDYPNYTLYLF